MANPKPEFWFLAAVLGQTPAPSNPLSCFIQIQRWGQRTNRNSRFPWSLSIDLSDHNCEGNCIKIIKIPTKTWTTEQQLSQIVFASVQLCVPSFAKVNDHEFGSSAEGLEKISSPKEQPWSQEKKNLLGLKHCYPPTQIFYSFMPDRNDKKKSPKCPSKWHCRRQGKQQGQEPKHWPNVSTWCQETKISVDK